MTDHSDSIVKANTLLKGCVLRFMVLCWLSVEAASSANVSCSYLRYASLPSVSLDNVVFEHSVLYLPFSSVVFAISSRCMTGRSL